MSDQTIQLKGTSLPMPPQAGACEKFTAGIERSKLESGSLGLGMLFILGGFLLTFILPIAFIPTYNGALIGIGFFLGLAALVVGMIFGIKQSIKANYRYQEKLEQFVQPYLAKGEQILAVSVAMRSGAAMWLVGISNIAYFVFTNKRAVMITLNLGKVVFRSANNYLKKDKFASIVKTVYVCDVGDKSKTSLGGILIPIGLHFTAVRLRVRPEGASDYVNWALYIKGTSNGKVIREIFAKRSAI